MSKIYIYDLENNELEMEVVTIFKFDDNIFNYIIYTDKNRSNYYAAKYVDEIDELNTDFSESELVLCNKVLEEII